MKKIFTLIIVLGFVSIQNAQSITGKLVDQNGNGLSGLQLQLYISPQVYNTTSGSDGSFTFNNITNVKSVEELPIGYEISNNFPNPFNPKTRIGITLPNSGSVRVDVYNLLGQRVRDEFERYFNTGDSYIDLELNGLPNGIYLARITLDEKYSVTKKLMLMYGSQHLSSSLGAPNIQLHKSTLVSKSTLVTNLDSLIATSLIIGRKTFKNLPSMITSSLNLGNLTIDRFCVGTPTVIYASKNYNTVQIGNQCWLIENLEVGTMIQGNQNATNNAVIEKYCYNNDANNCTIYGGLYQWNEAMAYSTMPGTKGICPDSWHIPTKAEFQTLITTINNEGNALEVIGQGAGTNTSGFSALMAGYRYDNSVFDGLGGYGTYFWSSTESDATACYLYLYGNFSDINYCNNRKELGFSVRCLKDKYLTPSVPTLSSPTNNAVDISVSPTLSWNSNIQTTSYTLQVSTNNMFSNFVYNQNGLSNTFQQISGLNNSTTYYWRVSATNNYGTSDYSNTWSFTTIGTPPSAPTLASPVNNAVDISLSPMVGWNSSTTATSYTLQVSTNSTFTSFVYNQSGLTNTFQQISGLSNSTMYYWRVSATNIYGSSNWSSTFSFRTVCVSSVTYAGKTYNTVRIGTQCWLKENLDVGTMIQGIQNASNNSTIEKYCYGNNPNNCETYGGLYQWNEAMAYSTTPGTKGICPDGWHIPTSAEFQTLASTVNNDGNALKAVGQGTGTNSSGFSALLAGYRDTSGGFIGLMDYTYFWHSTEVNTTTAYAQALGHGDGSFGLYSPPKEAGWSVRCVKD